MEGEEIENKQIQDGRDKVIEELKINLDNLQFFSDQVRFNSVMYKGLSLVLDKLTKIEASLDGKK